MVCRMDIAFRLFFIASVIFITGFSSPVSAHANPELDIIIKDAKTLATIASWFLLLTFEPFPLLVFDSFFWFVSFIFLFHLRNSPYNLFGCFVRVSRTRQGIFYLILLLS